MKSIKYPYIAIFSLVFLAGCAARPIVSGDSSLETKKLSYPEVGTKNHVAKNNLVAIEANYQSRFGYKLDKNISAGLALGKVNISTEDALVTATLKDRPVFCTVRKTFYDIFLGPVTSVCLEEGKKGFFIKMMAAPGEVWFTKNLEAPIPFSAYEIPVSDGSTALKREYFFEGYAKETIFFTEKEYINNIENPSRAKPLIIKINGIPSKISIGNMDINIIDVNDNALTFSVENRKTETLLQSK